MNNVFELKTGQHRPSSPEAFAAKIKRAKALRVSFDQRAVFSIEDQERAAANLHRLLEQLNEDRGLPKRQIAQEAGLGGSGDVDSTKRLDPYTLPEGASESRVGRLAKKPRKYFEIAEAIARILEEPIEGYVCQVFEGCSFGTGQEFEPDWEDEGWGRLAELLRRMSAAVIRDEDVPKYWFDVIKLNGRYDSKTGQLHQSNSALDSLGCEIGLASCSVFPDELPPIPSVLIGQRLMMEPHEDTLVLKDGRQIEAEFSLYLEARLALAPVNQDGLPGPMIEFRSRLDAFSETEGRIDFDNMHSDGSGGSDTIRSALINGAEVEIAEFPLLDVPEAECREDGFEHVYFAWEEVSPALLRSLFGEIERPFDIMFRERGIYVQELPPSRFPQGSAGFYLNAYLLTGELEKDLAAACRKCTDKVALFRHSLGQRIDEVEAEAEMRWTRGPKA
mgnify:CR=1 FL=1